MMIASILSVLEVSLSFDNAVVNATVLRTMDVKWRRRFITWGILIAVFGMRIVFPLLIVGIAAHLGPIETLMMAIYKPEDYERYLVSSHLSVAGFGGAFLMMVFLKFFFDEEKDVHWIKIIEAPLIKLGKIEAFEILITIFSIYFITSYLSYHGKYEFFSAGVMGVVTYIAVDGFGAFMESTEKKMAGQVAKAGLASFLYLELLDASFSFDGVIGAFALTNNLFIITIGLGIGAMFVRSLTIMLVENGALESYLYLEHGAFYAIGVLASIMFLGTLYEISEVITGLIGAGFIGIALISSILYNRTKQALN